MEHVCSNLPIFYTINCIKTVKYTCFKHRLYQSVNRKTHVCNAVKQDGMFTFTRFVATFLQYLPTDLKPINKIFRSLAWVAMTIRLSCKIYKLYEQYHWYYQWEKCRYITTQLRNFVVWLYTSRRITLSVSGATIPNKMSLSFQIIPCSMLSSKNIVVINIFDLKY